MRWSLGFLPIVGVAAGGILFGWQQLARALGAAPLFFGAVAVLLPILIAGGFHMDGFLDAADAIFSRRDRERRLQIMKDPHCGPFAVLCCGGLLLLELGSWSQLWAKPALLPAACVVFLYSRSLTVVAGSRFPYAATSTLGALFAGRAARGVSALSLAETAVSFLLLGGAGWLGGGFPGLLAAGTAGLGGLLLLVWFRRMTGHTFGGVTGDLLGFFVELSQMGMLLILAAASLFL